MEEVDQYFILLKKMDEKLSDLISRVNKIEKKVNELSHDFNNAYIDPYSSEADDSDSELEEEHDLLKHIFE